MEPSQRTRTRGHRSAEQEAPGTLSPGEVTVRRRGISHGALPAESVSHVSLKRRGHEKRSARGEAHADELAWMHSGTSGSSAQHGAVFTDRPRGP